MQESEFICYDGSCDGTSHRSITVDSKSGQVAFYNCHWPNRFFAWGPDDFYECRVEDVEVARLGTDSLGQLFLRTPNGRCTLSSSWTGFDELRRRIETTGKKSVVADRRFDQRWVIPIVLLVIGLGVAGLIYFLIGD